MVQNKILLSVLLYIDVNSDIHEKSRISVWNVKLSSLLELVLLWYGYLTQFNHHSSCQPFVVACSMFCNVCTDGHCWFVVITRTERKTGEFKLAIRCLMHVVFIFFIFSCQSLVLYFLGRCFHRCSCAVFAAVLCSPFNCVIFA